MAKVPEGPWQITGAVAAVVAVVLAAIFGFKAWLSHGNASPSAQPGQISISTLSPGLHATKHNIQHTTSPTTPAQQPVISSNQAQTSLLTTGQITTIAGTYVLTPLSSGNGLLLDLSVTQGQVSDPCNLAAVALLAPGSYSDVQSGYFNGGSISGGATIAEQVAAYSPGGGHAALEAAKAAFSGCGFSMAPGVQPNIIDFRGTAPNLNPGEWLIADMGDVLIEIGIDQSDKELLLRNLVDAISANVRRLRHA